MLLFILLALESHAQDGIYIETFFGQEKQVNYADSTGWETNQDMAVDSQGNLYMVWEAQPLTGANMWLSIWSSYDAGLNWQQLGYLYNPDADLRYPSIAVGEGLMNRLLIAYVVDDGGSYTHVEVAYAPLGSGNFVITTPELYSTSRVGPPEIWTDGSQKNLWRAYVACSEFNFWGQYDQLVAWRSELYGSSWDSQTILSSGDLSASWSRPHATFGTPSKTSFITYYRHDEKLIYLISTSDFGASFSAPIPIATLQSTVGVDVIPQINAARNYDHLMLCYSEHVDSNINVKYIYSTDNGDTWSSPALLKEINLSDLVGLALSSNEYGGQDWHLTYTRTANQSVMHHQYPMDDFTSSWSISSWVNQDNSASIVDPKKSMACHPVTDQVFVCWCDTRDGPYDTDTFFAYSGSLITDDNIISAATGGFSFFTLNAGIENASRTYLILGGVSGTKPGIPLPGNQVTLPLNWDLFTDLALSFLNTSVFNQFYGSLFEGSHGAHISVPPLDPAFIGIVMYFAYCLNNPFDFVSNPIAVEIVI